MSLLPPPDSDLHGINTLDAAEKRDGLRQKYRRTLAVGLLILIAAVPVYLASVSKPSVRVAKSTDVLLVDPLPPPPVPEPEPLPTPPADPSETIDIESFAPDVEPMEEGPASTDDSLGLDADGSGSGDGFGLKAKKGGRGLLKGQGGGGDPMQRFRHYAGTIERQLKHRFSDQNTLEDVDFSIDLKLWIAADGSVERCDLHRSTGQEAIDTAILSALGQSLKLPAPPSDLPQPVLIRVRSQRPT